jgi:tripartite ATP-independent transporter DctM subunit
VSTLAGALLFIPLLALLASGVWVAITLIIVGWGIIGWFTPASPSLALPPLLWSSTASWELSSLVLFIFMGEILCRTKLSGDLFHGCAVWLNRLPGRLLHVNVVACAFFGAVCGSSAATCATVAKISLPELTKRGYDENAIVGSLASAGTLGVMLPPSIIMIIYGAAAEVSILRVFIAGITVGILMAVLMTGWIIISAWMHPERVPPADPVTWKQRWKATKRLMPTLWLTVAVVGSMIAGIATSTEAAAVGVVGAFAIAWLDGELTWKLLRDSANDTMRTSVMIMFIIAASAFFSLGMAYTGLPSQIAALVAKFQVSPYTVITILTVIYIILGTVMDGASLILLTLSVVIPVVKQAGFDLVWFGIFMVLVVEIATITPPVGLNLFVMQAITGKDSMVIAKASIPYVFTMVLTVAIITMWPEVVSWLPNLMMGRS